MSPSSTRRLWPVPRRVGLALSHDGLSAVELARVGGHWQLEAQDCVALPGLFEGPPTLAQEAQLVQLLRPLAARWRKPRLQLHVAVPDVLGWLALWELEALPRRRALREALARWRLASEQRLDENALCCSVQALGMAKGRHRLLAQALDKDWLELLQRALREAGLAPWSLNQAFAYRYRHFRTRLTAARRGCALLSLDATAWSLLAWDADGRPCHLRGSTRARLDRAAPDWEALVEQVERSVLGFVHAAEGREIDQLFVTGDEPRLAEFAAVLDARLACASTVLVPSVPAAQSTASALATITALAA